MHIEVFKEKLRGVQPELEVVRMIKGTQKVEVQTKYGNCITFQSDALKGIKPSITTASDKKLYFTNQAIEIHGNKYDYSKVDYKNSNTKVNIICNSCEQEFLQVSSSHLSGAGCRGCCVRLGGIKKRINTEDYIKQANKVHNNKYDYSLTICNLTTNKITIICPEHGKFEQRASNHMLGRGCLKCSNLLTTTRNQDKNPGWNYSKWQSIGLESKKFDSFKVYIIRCWNDKESFYKIGRTYKTIKQRFGSYMNMPYFWETIKVIEGNGVEICELENQLHNEHKKYRYMPLIKFQGNYECFSEIILN